MTHMIWVIWYESYDDSPWKSSSAWWLRWLSKLDGTDHIRLKMHFCPTRCIHCTARNMIIRYLLTSWSAGNLRFRSLISIARISLINAVVAFAMWFSKNITIRLSADQSFLGIDSHITVIQANLFWIHKHGHFLSIRMRLSGVHESLPCIFDRPGPVCGCSL